MIYTVSYVVIGEEHPGMVQDEEKRPEVGDKVQLGDGTFEVFEVIELIPPTGDFAILHATCKPAAD